MSGNDQLSTEARWGVGCLVVAAAMVGAVILLMYVAFTFDLPIWAQVVVGFGLTLGGGLLTWLIVSALGQSRQRGTDTGPIATVSNRSLEQPPGTDSGPIATVSNRSLEQPPEQPPPGETGAE